MYGFNSDFLSFNDNESLQRVDKKYLMIKIHEIIDELSEEDLSFLLKILNYTQRT